MSVTPPVSSAFITANFKKSRDSKFEARDSPCKSSENELKLHGLPNIQRFDDQRKSNHSYSERRSVDKMRIPIKPLDHAEIINSQFVIKTPR